MLIAMLVFMYLDRMNAKHKRPAVFWGLAAGVVASMFIALGFKTIAGITHAHQELFEGSVMLIAAGMLGYVSFFCHNAKHHGVLRCDKRKKHSLTFQLQLTSHCLQTILDERE
jgi:high-affinity iron transporter